MMPNHSGNRPQRGSSPYSITRRTVPGGVTVTIQGSTPFKGFMMQAQPNGARLAPGAKNLGNWQWEPQNDVQAMPECAAITHTKREGKNSMEATFVTNQPNGIDIYVTVVQDYATYWSNIRLGPEHETGRGGSGPSGLSGPSGFPGGLSGSSGFPGGLPGPTSLSGSAPSAPAGFGRQPLRPLNNNPLQRGFDGGQVFFDRGSQLGKK